MNQILIYDKNNKINRFKLHLASFNLTFFNLNLKYVYEKLTLNILNITITIY